MSTGSFRPDAIVSQDADTAVELDVILAGEVTMPKGYVFRPSGGLLGRLTAFRPGSGSLRAPLLAFAVRHPSAGTILIDTGLHPDAAEDLNRDYGRLLGLVFRSLRPAAESYEQQLRGLGIEPGEVRLVVMTHLHADHTSGMRLLPEAEFVCSRDEWDAATGKSAALKGYVSGHLPPASGMRLIDPEREGESHGPFRRTIDLLGDGSIRLISTPGHSAGHLSVLLRLPGGRQVLLVGDAAYTLRSIDEQILPLFTAGDGRYRRSLGELKAYAEAEPDTVLVPTHDPDAWRALEAPSAAAARTAV